MPPRRAPRSTPAQGHRVGPEALVVFSYDLYDAEGELVESSHPAQPLSFVFGVGQMVPAIERALDGAAVGQIRRVRLKPEEAYGSRDDTALIEVHRSELPADVSPGDELAAESESGSSVLLKVLQVDTESAVLDTNHPLAGQRVEIDITIEEIRPASSEELQQALERLEQSASQGVQSLLPVERLLKRQGSHYDGGSDPPAASHPLKSSSQS